MSDVFYSDPNSDLAKLQAKGRWHRKLDPNVPMVPVVIYDLLTPESIDADILRRIAEKRAANSRIEGGR